LKNNAQLQFCSGMYTLSADFQLFTAKLTKLKVNASQTWQKLQYM